MDIETYAVLMKKIKEGGGGESIKLTVTCTADNGTPVDGVTVTLTKTTTGTVEDQKEYKNKPIVFSIKPDVQYTVSFTEMEGYGTPKAVNVVTESATQIEAVYQFGHIYGVMWNKTATTVLARTDDAALFADPVPYVAGATEYGSPFDDLYPWKDMKIVEDEAAGTLVAIPKFWFRIVDENNTLTIQIADTEREGFAVSPAHRDRGDGKGERDVVYIGRYHCAATTYRSTTGVKPQVSITRATAREAIKKLGEGIYQNDYALFWTTRILYLVEYADWNCQKVIGYGRGNGSSVQEMGYTDGMPYHTGCTFANRTTYGVSTQYRYIEGLWDNCVDWCDGITFSGANVYAQFNPDEYSDVAADGVLICTRPTASGFISGWTVPIAEGYEWAMYPAAVAGSEATYAADYCSYNAGGVVLRVGGYYSANQDCGLFYLYGSNGAGNADQSIGSRLQKIP